MRFRFHHTSSLALIVLVGLSIASCKGRGPSGPKGPAFALSAAAIVFSDENNQRLIEISNLGNDPLDWRVLSSTASWLSASPSSGVLQPGASGTLVVQVDRVAVSEGTHSAALQIGAAGQSAFISVSVQEPQTSPAVASLQPSVITIGPLDASKVIEVVNAGGSTLTWTLSGPSWATLTPGSGSVAPGERSQILLTANRTGLTNGQYIGTLQLSSNGGSPTATLELNVSGFAGLGLDPATLDFGATTTQLFMGIRNDGDQSIQWSAFPGASWLSVSPSSGTLPPGLSQLLTVTVSRSGMSLGHNETTVEFTSNGGSAVATVVAEVGSAGGPSPPPSGTPLLTISPVFLDFQQSATQLSLSLHNEGDEHLEWTAQPEASWISLPVSAGSISPHSNASVVVMVSRSGLTAGTYQSALQFASNGGAAVATIAMTVSGSPPDSTPPPPPDPDPGPGPGPPPAASISLNPTSLDFGSAGTKLPVVIQNTGGAPLDWLAFPADGYLSVSPSSGRIEPGVSQTVQVLASRSDLTAAGLYESSIQFDSNGGSLALPVTLSVAGEIGFCNPESSPAGADGPIDARVLACGSHVHAASLTTTIISPAANALVLVWVGSLTSDPTNLPTVSGGGMTWELVETHIRNAGLRRLSVFRGMSSTPSAGLLTIDFGGQEQDAAGWGVVQHTGVDPSGVNGSGAIVQTGVADAEGFDTYAMIDLNPSSSAGNATVGGFLAGTFEDISPGDGFVEVFESGVPRRRVMVEFQPSPSTSVDASWPDPNHWIGIALELKSTKGN